METPSRIVVAEGAWAAERRAVAEIERALPAGTLPAAPVVAVVPSQSLREHLLGRLLESRPAWLGLEVTTLAGLALAIAGRARPAPRSGAPLVPVFVRRLAARERALAEALGGLARGFDQIGGAVRDLLDAGFVEAHLAAVEERLELERAAAGAGAVARAAAIARVAAGVRRELAALDLAPPGDLLAAATERLAEDADAALPASAVVVHGFADLTGLGADLLAALVRHLPTAVVLDSPPGLDGRPGDWRFGRRLFDRLRGLAPVEREPALPGDAAARSAFRAADPGREARAALGWLAAGAGPARPEACALVAREIGSELSNWRREADRQAVPVASELPLSGPLDRRAAAALELLALGDDAPLGTALEFARERLEAAAGAPLSDLRLAFAIEAARTLGAGARLAPPGRPLELPLADRLETGEDGRARAASRRVPPAALAAARAVLGELRAGAAEARGVRPLGERAALLRRWLERTLPAGDAAALAAPVEPLAGAPFAPVPVDAEEWRLLLERAWRDAPLAPDQPGGGVALLSVTGARGRTFERLALAGVSRDRFPRAVRADPLLPDALRLRLRELLPDLPVKSEGHDEERYLFAQLAAAARELALFRPLADALGRPLAPSPLGEELLRDGRIAEAIAPRPDSVCALDRAVAAALGGGRSALGAALGAALAEASARFGDSRGEPERIGAARAALLDRCAPAPASTGADRLGPYLGAVGSRAAEEPPLAPPPATALERFAGCGWRQFLERVLRLVPLPELVEGVPSLPARLAGSVVHRVLERLAPEPARALPLERAADAPALDCAWPPEAALEPLARAEARRALAGEALDPDLYAAPLVRAALALLGAARALDWPDGRRALLAVECAGVAAVEYGGAPLRIGFRADRVERAAEQYGERLVLTDYKTGKPLTDRLKPETRARHLAAAIARGEALQLPLYLLGVPGRAARARYLYLAPEPDERTSVLALDSEELDRGALARVLGSLLAAWEAGAFVPRLLEPDLRTIYAGCQHCDVREACLQGDSDARRRLAAWASGPERSGPWERAARAWWELRAAPGARGAPA